MRSWSSPPNLNSPWRVTHTADAASPSMRIKLRNAPKNSKAQPARPRTPAPVIAAPPARVWRAITDPEQIAQWFSPGTSWDMTKLAVGGRLFVRDAESGAELYPQEITLLDEPHQLALRSIVDPPETPKLSLYTLREEAAGTRLTITHSGYELDPEGAREPAMEQNAFGFGMMLGNIKAVVEGLPLPTPGGF